MPSTELVPLVLSGRGRTVPLELLTRERMASQALDRAAPMLLMRLGPADDSGR